jgi:hypothetical protein
VALAAVVLVAAVAVLVVAGAVLVVARAVLVVARAVLVVAGAAKRNRPGYQIVVTRSSAILFRATKSSSSASWAVSI